MTAMTSLEAATALSGKADASRTYYQKDVAALDDPDVTLFDFMDHTYIRTVQNLPVLGAVTWNKGGSLTSLSFDYYGTVNHWSTILLYNGYISGTQIPPGATVNLPDVSSLKVSMQTSNKGKVVQV